MFFPLNKPPQWLLDGLYVEDKSNRNCPDCGVAVGIVHQEGCDVARCTKCGEQRLGCSCKRGSGDIWTGLWPGTQEAYDNKYVVYDTATGRIVFDLNRAAFVRGGGIPKNTSDKAYAKYQSSGWPIKLGGEGWQ
jgi:hypothetical protein